MGRQAGVLAHVSMEITLDKKFYKGEPGKPFENHCKKVYGTAKTKAILRRFADAFAAVNLSVLRMQGFPGRWHWLTGDRRGQISADVSKMERLVFLPQESMSEIEVDGILHEERVMGLIAIEITDTHD